MLIILEHFVDYLCTDCRFSHIFITWASLLTQEVFVKIQSVPGYHSKVVFAYVSVCIYVCVLPGCVLRWWCYTHVGGRRSRVSGAHTHILLLDHCTLPPTGSLRTHTHKKKTNYTTDHIHENRCIHRIPCCLACLQRSIQLFSQKQNPIDLINNCTTLSVAAFVL